MRVMGKKCSECGIEKADNQFNKKRSDCRDCQKIYAATRKYGLTKEEYLDLIDDDCHACGRSQSSIAAKVKAFHIDHCHDSGRVRGLLCHYCNVSLGLLLDDPTRIRKLEMYLNRCNYDESNTL